MILLILTATVRAQVKFPEYIEHNDATKALVDQEQIRGHHWSVIDKTARDAVPADKREIGMLVTWIQDSKYVTRRYQGSTTLNADWVDDLNWTEFIIESDTIAYADTAIYVKNLTSVDSINFNDVKKETFTEGNLAYDSASRSLQFINDISGFRHNLGYEFVVRVWNETGSLIPNGTVVTMDTIKLNGQPIPTIHKAGMGSLDSLLPIGMTTVDIPNNSYGIVTIAGEVKGLDTQTLTTGLPVFVGNDGGLIDYSPEPPNFSLLLGYCFYADNDSGSIYLQPEPVGYDPSPHIAGDTSRYNQVLTITVQNQFEYLPISNTHLEDIYGFTVIGDSIRVDVTGHITIALNLSYTGNAQSDVWRKGIFVNGVENNTVSRSTTSTSVGNSTVIATTDVLAGDYISFKLTNESAVRSPTINDLSFEIIFLHRE